ncbi:MAG TPA: hypothetical protein VLB87_10700 [Pyrinomonadaceae bacterium]|nr:hypothetical protein [Pyrinomonadaceae bacterium]
MTSILAIAHPGHELRVHHWLETNRPEVWVLTDGSGHTGRSRIDSTTRVLQATGAVAGPVYAHLSDLDLYDAVLNFEHRPFIAVVDQLAAALMQENVSCIAGDAEEGYNPAHDICRLIVNAAVNLVQLKQDQRVPNYDFTLAGVPAPCADEPRDGAILLNLDDAAFARKVSAARNYPELQAEVEAAFNGTPHAGLGNDPILNERSRSTYGVTTANNFRVECLRPVALNGVKLAEARVPFYEEYGERQVKAGHYTRVLRYREHMLPLAEALDAHLRGAAHGGA